MEDFVLKQKLEHIAFIMDGNGRWAKERGLPRYLGHKEGCERIIEIFDVVKEYKIKVMSLYAFSTENWNRPKDEIRHLFNYLNIFFKNNIKKFEKDGIRVQIMGDISKLPIKSQRVVKDAIERTKDNENYILNIALNYGSHEEIIKATKEIAYDVKEGKLDVDDIDENMIEKHLYTSNLPPVDLMIRTSGEQRLSNFLLYQLAYSEFIFTPTYWPDFKRDKLIECLKEFDERNRRFGKI